MKIDLSKNEMILIHFCLKFADYANPNVLFDSEDGPYAIDLHRQLIAKIVLELETANSSD